MQLKAIPLALFLITSFAIATPAFAETSPEDAYDYRHAVMESQIGRASCRERV